MPADLPAGFHGWRACPPAQGSTPAVWTATGTSRPAGADDDCGCAAVVDVAADVVGEDVGEDCGADGGYWLAAAVAVPRIRVVHRRRHYFPHCFGCPHFVAVGRWTFCEFWAT
jgi:hypothetical protein